LTVIFLDELSPNNRLENFLVIELRNVPFAQQWQVILYIMNTLPNFAGGAFDSRGNGQMIAEYAAQEYPGVVSQVMITTAWYAATCPKLKERMEESTTTIPDDPAIREDFRAVGLKAGVPCILERKGAVKAKRHGDAAIAKLMAVYAFEEDDGKGYQPMTYSSVKINNKYRTGGKDLWDD